MQSTAVPASANFCLWADKMNDISIKVTDDPKALDVDEYLRLLRGSYWASSRTDDEDRRGIANSRCFSVLVDGKWAGGARIISDGAVNSLLCDVIVAPEHRGKGLGRRLIDYILGHPNVRESRVFLVTKDAQKFYQTFGFKTHPFECMMRPKSAQPPAGGDEKTAPQP